jgi:hypothetical protein
MENGEGKEVDYFDDGDKVEAISAENKVEQKQLNWMCSAKCC